MGRTLCSKVPNKLWQSCETLPQSFIYLTCYRLP